MNLYYHPLSGCSRRVLALISVYEIPVELTIIDLMRGEHKQAAYLAKNPNGKVPVLEDGELTLWESGAIMRYLASKHAPAALGEGELQRAHVDQWLFWCLSQLGAALSQLNQEVGLKRMRGLPVDEAQAQLKRAEVAACLEVLDGALSSHEAQWIAQTASPSIADLAIAASVESCMGLSGLELTQPHVTQWLNTLRAQRWPASPTKP